MTGTFAAVRVGIDIVEILTRVGDGASSKEHLDAPRVIVDVTCRLMGYVPQIAGYVRRSSPSRRRQGASRLPPLRRERSARSDTAVHAHSSETGSERAECLPTAPL